MKNIKISLIFLLSSIFSINLSAVPEGAFTTLMVQAKDIDKYVELKRIIKDNFIFFIIFSQNILYKYYKRKNRSFVSN